MTEHVRFADLEHWLSTDANHLYRFPPKCARSFAALVAHYGRRLDRSVHEDALREALITYLSEEALRRKIAARQPDYDAFDDLMDSAEQLLVIDPAEQLLLRIEEARGGTWPIDSTPTVHIPGPRRHPQFPAHTVDQTVRTMTTLQVERGLGKRTFGKEKRSLTDDALALLLGVSILRTATKGAVDIAADVLDALGISGSSGPTAAVTESRTRTIVREFLNEQHSWPVPKLTPDGVRAAYEKIADQLKPDTMVCLRRKLPQR